MTPAELSVVILARNEAANLQRLLPQLLAAGYGQIVLADGGSNDGSQELARQVGAEVIVVQGGRGPQLRAGALAARLPYLWFLHADSQLPPQAFAAMQPVLQAGRAGAFSLAIDALGWPYRLIEWGTKLRNAITRMPYGDQSLFLPRSLYWSVGGHPAIALMEDLALSCALKRAGMAVQIVQPALTTSARRWQQDGLLRRTLGNWRLALAYHWLDADPAKLAERYNAAQSSKYLR